jgi:hypothetical protein
MKSPQAKDYGLVSGGSRPILDEDAMPITEAERAHALESLIRGEVARRRAARYDAAKGDWVWGQGGR